MSTITELVKRYWVGVAATVLALVVVVAGVGLLFPSVLGRTAMTTYTAYFDEAPGLYEDNAINILGVNTGKVVSVTPNDRYVTVKFEVPSSTKLPTDVRAVLMAPNPISDRTIELFPPYVTKPGKPAPARLAGGATIPLNRTAVPLSVDKVFSAVDDLTRALGPDGANKNGALSSVVRSLAAITDGNGVNLQKTLSALATALPTFTANPGQIASLINSLDRLSTTLARNNSTVDRFFTDVTVATKELADERDTLGAAIDNLQVGLSRAADFIRANKGALNGSLRGLATTGQALVADQKSLMKTFRTAALGFDNFNRTIDTTARCAAGQKPNGSGKCPVAFARLDLPANVQKPYQTYCRSALQETVPILVNSVPGLGGLLAPLLPGASGTVTPTTVNTLCLINAAALQGRPGSPGAPAIPDLGLGRFLP